MEAITGKHSEEYLEAMGIEMQALQRAVTWDIVPRSQVPRTTNILPLTWVYKLKHYPDGCPRSLRLNCVSEEISKSKELATWTNMLQWSVGQL